MFPGDKTPGLEFGHFRIGGGIDLPFFVGSFVRNFVGMNAVPEVLYPLETFLTPFRPWINEAVRCTCHPDRPGRATLGVLRPKENLSHARNHFGDSVVI